MKTHLFCIFLCATLCENLGKIPGFLPIAIRVLTKFKEPRMKHGLNTEGILKIRV